MRNELKQFGLNGNEAKVYLAMLELGASSIQRISKKAGIKRTTAYGAIDSLKEKSLVVVSKGKNRTSYYAESPLRIRDQLDQKKAAFEKLLPEMLAITNAIDKKPTIRYYEGLEELKEVLWDTLNYPKHPIEAWIHKDTFKSVGREFWYEEYMPKRVSNKMFARTIAPDTKEFRKYHSEDKKYLRKSKIENGRGFKCESEIQLYGGKFVGLILWGELMGLIIESRQLYTTLKSIFERHWASLPE